MNKKIKSFIFGVGIFLITLSILSGIYFRNRILALAKINDILVWGLTKAEAYQVLADKTSREITLTYQEKIVYQGESSSLGVIADFITPIEEAYQLNRSFSHFAIAKDILIPVGIDTNKIQSVVKSADFLQLPKDAEVKIENNQIKEIKEKAGQIFDFDYLAVRIEENPFQPSYELTVIDKEPTVKLADLAAEKKKLQAELTKQLAELAAEKAQASSGDFTAGLYAGKYIEIDLSKQKLATFEGENKLGEYAISSGKWSMPTPVGTFAINGKTDRAYSSKYALYMPYWMAFIGNDYGIHALPEWPSGYKEGENHLGTPVSHGCVRLSTEAAQNIYSWADVGTPVNIHS